MKRLVLEAVHVPQFEYFVVRVVEQTYRNDEFGHDGAYERREVSPIKLCSISYPEGVDKTSFTFYVRGSVESADKRAVTVPADMMEDLRRIVRKYNEEFSGSVPMLESCEVETIC